MSSMQSPFEEAGAEGLRLPAHGTTVIAEDLRVRLVLASDVDGDIVVDASDVESVGQAVLQLLVAAREEALRNGQSFAIANPSPAFLHRIRACGMGGMFGVEQEEILQ